MATSPSSAAAAASAETAASAASASPLAEGTATSTSTADARQQPQQQQQQQQHQHQQEQNDNLSLWSKKWDDDQTGWHKRDLNYILRRHGALIIPGGERGFGFGIDDDDEREGDNDCASNAVAKDTTHPSPVRVFVPLCGKTLDMVHLARHEGVGWVNGVDGVSKAVEEFAAENPELKLKRIAKANIDETNTIEVWMGDKITVTVDDYFKWIDATFVEKPDAVWDRASLVAIAPDKRRDYVAIMGKMIKPGGKILLVTIDKRRGDEDALKTGPPYSVDHSIVRELYEGADWVESVELIQEYDDFAQNPEDADRWRSKGIEEMYELVFLITAKMQQE
mmetsp:Transcript_2998/g.6926  ORF Transcript_2998/g.6926 Transcript_2998/m.6926 type:complete len:336 (+) Transcript_2998:59-1066(+)